MSTELRAGTVLQKGKYTIVKSLGQGSFGITYLASTKLTILGKLGKMDTTVNVAIKEFFMSEMNSRANDGSSLDGSSGSLFYNYQQKFRKEAENLSRLDHPNIVKVLEVFDENNTTYYVMQYIDGESLDNYILRQNGLPEQKSISILKEVGSAVQYMHSNKMLHLDLKPKNVMLDKDGKSYLIDFGLSKQYTENGEPESSTKVGAGTPGYAPIEQANYREGKGFPVTMDVYALGGTLFKMLTGKRPPEASEILNDGFPLYELQEHNVHDALSASVAKAMAPTKKDRYQSVVEFLNAINNEEEATIVDIEIAEKEHHTRRDTDLNTGDYVLNIHNDTRKVRIEYYPSVFSGKEEYIREISYDCVRYMHGHNLYSPFKKEEGKWSKYSISRGNFEKFLTNLNQLKLKVNPDGSDREEWGTDNTRLKIILYDEQNKEYNTIWKYSWADEYGGGENGKLYGSPTEIYERIINILPQESQNHLKNHRSSIPFSQVVSSSKTNEGLKFEVVGNTNVGLQKMENGDCFAVSDTANGIALIVCDGGENEGCLSTETIARSILDSLDETEYKTPNDAIKYSIENAHLDLLRISNEERKHLLSTCSLVLVNKSKIYSGSVGNCRAYYLSPTLKLTQLTKDQSYVQELVDSGVISQEQAKFHPQKDEGVNALGLKDFLPPHLSRTNISLSRKEGGSYLLVCSDGLSNYVSDSEIIGMLRSSDISLREKADGLVRLAIENGSNDNVTVILCKFLKGTNKEERASPKEAKRPDLKSPQDENELRQIVEHLKECGEYKEAYKTCLQYIKEGRCKSVAQELSQELVPLMKKQNQRQNRKQVVIVTVVTIIVMILSILLNSLR